MTRFLIIKPLYIAIAFANGFLAKAADTIEGGKSPKGHYEVVALQNGPVSIVDRGGHVHAELVGENDERTNIEFHCVWASDESKLAVLMYYGTKMCALDIYARQKSGLFRRLVWKQPNLHSYYQSVPEGGIQEYDIGKWRRSTHLSVRVGIAIVGDDGALKHLMLDVGLSISSVRVNNDSVKRLGLISNDKMEAK